MIVSKKIIRRLEREGWKLERVNGSHHHFRKEGNPNIVTIPHPRKDMPAGTLRSICRAAGWKYPPDL